MAGFKDPESFINTEVPHTCLCLRKSKPDAAELLAQAEAQKAQVQAQKAIIDAETDRMKIIMDDDRSRDIEEAQIRLKAAELLAKYGTQVNIAEINAIMERDREIYLANCKRPSFVDYLQEMSHKIFDIEVMEGEIVHSWFRNKS